MKNQQRRIGSHAFLLIVLLFSPTPATIARSRQRAIPVELDAAEDTVATDSALSIRATTQSTGHDPTGSPPSSPSSSWEEYPLASFLSVQDFQGGIWCALADQEGKISRWDGHTWQHFDQGFSMSDLSELWVDNLQRLYFITKSTNPQRANRRLTGTRTEDFDEITTMILDSVESGSRRFRGSSRWPSAPLITRKQEIWIANHRAGRFARYAGGTWQPVFVDPSRASLFEDSSGRVLMQHNSPFVDLETGTFVLEPTRRGEYVLSESGLWPFDGALCEAHPREFFPARRANDAVYVFGTVKQFESFDLGDSSTWGPALSRNLDRIWLADGGFWVTSDNASQLQRYCKGLLLTVNFAETPVVGALYPSNCAAYEDSSGDLWIRRNRTLFHAKRPALQTHITSPQAVATVSPTTRIEFAAHADEPIDTPLRYTWRVDGGPWSEPTERRFADAEFPRSGLHRVEVLSIGPMASVDATPAEVIVNVRLLEADVRVVSAPQSVVANFDAAISYETVGRLVDRDVTFQWRIDGGPWRQTRETTVWLPPLDNGEHRFEVRSVTDGRYVQDPCATVRFGVQIDHEQAIRSAIENFSAPDYDRREAAARGLVFFGGRALPHLEEALVTADEDAQWWIQAVMDKIKRAQPRSAGDQEKGSASDEGAG